MLFDKSSKRKYIGYLMNYPDELMKYLEDMNKEGWECVEGDIFDFKFKKTDQHCTYHLEYGDLDEEHKQELEEHHYDQIPGNTVIYKCKDDAPEILEFRENDYKEYLKEIFKIKYVFCALVFLFLMFLFSINTVLELPKYPLSMYFYLHICDNTTFEGFVLAIAAFAFMCNQIHGIYLLYRDRFNYERRKTIVKLTSFIMILSLIVFTLLNFGILLIIVLLSVVIVKFFEKYTNKTSFIPTLVLFLVLFSGSALFSEMHERNIREKFCTSDYMDLENDENNMIFSNDIIYEDLYNKDFHYIHVNADIFNSYIIRCVILENTRSYKNFDQLLKESKHGEIDGISYIQINKINYIYKDNVIYYANSKDYSLKELMNIYNKY